MASSCTWSRLTSAPPRCASTSWTSLRRRWLPRRRRFVRIYHRPYVRDTHAIPRAIERPTKCRRSQCSVDNSRQKRHVTLITTLISKAQASERSVRLSRNPRVVFDLLMSRFSNISRLTITRSTVNSVRTIWSYFNVARLSMLRNENERRRRCICWRN